MGKGMVPDVPIQAADFYSPSINLLSMKTTNLLKTRKHGSQKQQRYVDKSFLGALCKPQRWQLSHNLHVKESEAQDFMFSLLREVKEPAQASANED